MAYQKAELAQVGFHGAGTNGYREYHYENTAADDVTAANFFDGSAGQIYSGDVIVDGDTNRRYTATNTAGVISVAEVTDSA